MSNKVKMAEKVVPGVAVWCYVLGELPPGTEGGKWRVWPRNTCRCRPWKSRYSGRGRRTRRGTGRLSCNAWVTYTMFCL